MKPASTGQPGAPPAAAPAYKALRIRALRLLAGRSFTKAELTGRLLPHALAALAIAPANEPSAPTPRPDRHDKALALAQAQAQVQQVLEGLAAEGLLNDQQVAQTTVASKAARMGERRLRQVLQQKGLAQDDIQAALQVAREGGLPSELERAQALWAKRFGSTCASGRREPAAEQARQMRFLLMRGFSAQVAAKVISGGWQSQA